MVAKTQMTLATRLAAAMILLVALTVSAVGWLSYRNLEQALLPRVLDRIETHSRFVATEPGCVKTRRLRLAGRHTTRRSYARIASIKPPTPRMLITLFIL